MCYNQTVKSDIVAASTEFAAANSLVRDSPNAPKSR